MATFSNAKLKASTVLTSFLTVVAMSQTASALPTGGNVVGGQASISAGQNGLNINQSSNRAIINWNKFDIGANEQVNFVQPSSSSIALNRVVNSNAPSQIHGKLNANGNVVIVNSHGVLFGKGAQVNVGGLVATTADVSNDDFMKGNLNFSKAGNPNGKIQNDGDIKIKEGGLGLLVGPNVVNNGLIEAKLGKVQLASGDKFSVDLYGDGLINLQASKDLNNQLVQNSGKIEANGGSVLITAAAAESTVNSLINMDGLIQADNVGTKNGKVVLIGKSNKDKDSTVLVSGQIKASGGEAQVLGDKVALLDGSSIDVSGANGGTILVGGDYLGKGDIQTAAATVMQEGAELLANAIGSGNGGKVILWSDEYTGFYGRISAKGGEVAGNGGFVETSSKNNLQAFGSADASATNGKNGAWLLDPRNVTISNSDNGYGQAAGVFTPTSDSATINVATILNALTNSTNVTITTGSTGTQLGNITVANTINKTNGGNASLTLNAANNIITNSNVNISSSSNKLDVSLVAGGSISLGNSSDIITNGGNASLTAGTTIGMGSNSDVTTNGGNVTYNSGGAISLGNSARITSAGGNILLRSTGGAINLTNNNNVISSDKASSTADGSITLVGTAFTSSAGSDAFNAGSNRYLIYTVKPENDTVDGVTSDFTRYSCSYGGSCPTFPATGNGFLYSYSPIVNLTINPVGKSIVYGSVVPTFSYTLSGYNAGDAAIDVVTGSAGFTTNYTQGSSVGSYNITSSAGSLVSSLGYTFVGSTLTNGLVVTAKELGVGLTGSVSKIYDGNNNATLAGNNYSLTGVYGTDAVSISNTSGTYDNKNAGSGKTVTVTGLALTGAKAGNYTLASTSASGAVGSIDKRALAITAAAENKVYDGNTNATITLSDNRVAGDVFTRSYTNANFSDKNVGTGKTVTVSGLNITGTDAGNYSFNTSATALANITKKILTITAAAQNKVYDGNTSATVTLSDNRVSGDVLTTSNTAANFNNKNAGTGKTVTVTGIDVTGTDSGNYSFNTSATTTANITKRALTVTAAAENKVYDGNRNATVTLSDNRVAGDVFTRNTTSARFNNKNVGVDKTVTVSGISLSGTDSGNYTVNSTATTLANITKRLLTVGSIAIDKTYDGTTDATVILTDNRVFGDSISRSYLDADFSDKNAGNNKTVATSGISISGSDSGNYTLANTTAIDTANIYKRGLLITANGIDKVYDGNANASVTLSDNRVSGDVLDTSYGSATYLTGKNVGNNKVVVVGGLNISGTEAGNYFVLNPFNGALTTADITKRILTISALADNKVYDGTIDATVTLSDDRVAGDVFTRSFTSASFDNKNVGVDKTVTVSGINISSGDAQNYSFNTSATDIADITTRGLTVTADAKSKVYGSSDPSLTYTFDALQSGDDASIFSGGLVREAGENVADGPYEIGQGSLSAGQNYSINYVGADLTITPYSLLVTADAKSKIYGSADPSLTYTYGLTLPPEGIEGKPFVLNGLQNGDTDAVFSGGLDRVAGEHVADGPFAINQGTLSAGSNYTINYIGNNLIITPASLDVIANNQSILFGSAFPAFTFTANGLVNGDTNAIFSGNLITNAPAGANPGNYDILRGSLEANSDYIVSYTPGVMTVTTPIDDVNSTTVQGVINPVIEGFGGVGSLLSLILPKNQPVTPQVSFANLETASGGNNEGNPADLETAAGGDDVISLIECNKSSIESKPCQL